MLIPNEDIDASLDFLRSILDLDQDYTNRNNSKFISLNPRFAQNPDNLLNEMLSDTNYRGIVTAFLENCDFSSLFSVAGYNYEQAIIHKFDSYGDEAPDQINIHSDFPGRNFTATQFATFNLVTRELTYTKYVVHPHGSYYNRSGDGKLPLDANGYFVL